jgi:hypothetical protein
MTRDLRWKVVVASSMFVPAVPVVPAWAQVGEKKVTIDEVPPKVKDAIVNAVGEGRLIDIGFYSDEGKWVYEIEMVVDGKEFDVLFADDGKELRRTFEGVRAEGRGKKAAAGRNTGEFQDDFGLQRRDLVSTGRNRYFVLEPGYQLVLEGKEGEHTVTLAVTVLPNTKWIGNVETRVVEERETVDGELIEISRNFFAMCTKTSSVFYFGEEVDIYADGRMVGHEGAWIHGKKGARAGMMMPGDPVLGARYYQEVAPEVAMDRAVIVDVNATLKTPAGGFRGCLKMAEENPLDGEKEFKLHAPGIGLVQDEDLLLVRHGFMARSE